MAKSKQSHPRSLWRTVKKTLIDECFIDFTNPLYNHILIGVSGGSDSMALLHVLAVLRKEMGFQLTAVGVNHNLREEAASELDVVEEFCKELEVDFYRKDVYIEGESNIQCKARDARYKAIREVKEKVGANYIVTAHHKADKAETVLMKILRQTTVSGLNVLNPQDGDLLRPMIRATKEDVMLHIERKSIKYCEDPSNKKTDKYLRSKVRYDIMPELEKINPNLQEALCNLADSAAEL